MTPRLEIEYCRQCRWLLRAAWLAQELLTTFEKELGEVALVPGTNGIIEGMISCFVYARDLDSIRRERGGMVIILMGVTASGKTTVGCLLASVLGYQFYDADDFHPRVNIDKMRRGIPLDDADRLPWLETLRNLVRRCLTEHTNAVLACSALKQAYQRYLLVDSGVTLVYLKADHDLI